MCVRGWMQQKCIKFHNSSPLSLSLFDDVVVIIAVVFLAAKRKPSAQPLFTAVLPSVRLSVWELVGYVPDIVES